MQSNYTNITLSQNIIVESFKSWEKREYFLFELMNRYNKDYFLISQTTAYTLEAYKSARMSSG